MSRAWHVHVCEMNQSSKSYSADSVIQKTRSCANFFFLSKIVCNENFISLKLKNFSISKYSPPSLIKI